MSDAWEGPRFNVREDDDGDVHRAVWIRESRRSEAIPVGLLCTGGARDPRSVMTSQPVTCAACMEVMRKIARRYER